MPFQHLYIFDHISKTAGTTLKFSYVPAAFDAAEALISDSLEQSISSLGREKAASLRFIGGHRAASLRSLFPKARWLTLVRDPVERAISVYLHACHHPEAWALIGREVKARGLSLKAFVEEDFFFRCGGEPGSVKNQQTRVLLGPGYDARILDDPRAVAEIIRSRFHLCGCTESFEKFLFLLHVTEGWPLVLFTNRLVRKERLTFQPDPEALAVIERFNRHDAILYNCVRAEFNRRLAAVWTAEVGRLWQAYISALRDYRAGACENEVAASVAFEDRLASMPS